MLANLGDIKHAFNKSKVLALDLETIGENKEDAKNIHKAEILFFALASERKAGCFKVTEASVNFVTKVFNDPTATVVVHNAPFDIGILHFTGTIDVRTIKCTVHDTKVMAWMHNEEILTELKSLVRQHFKHNMVSYKEAFEESGPLLKIKEIEDIIKEKDKQFEKSIKKANRSLETTVSKAVTRMNQSRRRVVLKKWGVSALRDLPEEGRKEIEELAQRNREELTAAIKSGNNLVDIDWPDRFKHKREKAKMLKPAKELYTQAEGLMMTYAADDARQTLRLYRLYSRWIEKSQLSEWHDVEQLCRIECIKVTANGMAASISRLKELDERLGIVEQRLRAELFDMVKQEFNPNSHQQRSRLLWNTMGLTPPPRTPVNSYGPSTDKNTLERLEHPIGLLLLSHGTVSKLLGGFIRKFLEAGKEKEEFYVTHARLNSIGAKTGRATSSAPNLQQIPSRPKPGYHPDVDFAGREVRWTFVPRPGNVFIDSDMSQIELRLLCNHCRCGVMKAVYLEGFEEDGIFYYSGDIHETTRIGLEKYVGHSVTRMTSKECNFGLPYGLGNDTLAMRAGLFKQLMAPIRDEYGMVTKLEPVFDKDGKPVMTYEWDPVLASKIKTAHFSQYIRLKQKQDSLRRRSNMGERKFPTVSLRNRHYSKSEHGGTILNGYAQSSAADYLKAQLWIFAKYILCHPEFSSLKIVNQIHDEYMFECPKEEAEKCGLIVKYVMELALFPSEIPFLAQTYICENWRDKENEVGHLPASGKKVTVAMLSQEDKDWCAQFIPVDMPLFGKRKEGTRQLSIEEYRKIKGDL